MSRASFHLFLSPLSILFFGYGLSAQTTLINTPTADTLPRGIANVEFDFTVKPAPYSEGGFQTYGYRLSYGLDHKTEIGTNFYFTREGKRPTAQAEISLKRNFYHSEKRGLKVSGGAVALLPLRAAGRDRSSLMFYGVSGKSIRRFRGLTITGGAYHILRGRRDFGTRTGAIIGLNQPISRRIAFVADWYSGSNRIGYSSAGVTINITKKQYLTTGYSFGNTGRGNNALSVYYGVIF